MVRRPPATARADERPDPVGVDRVERVARQEAQLEVGGHQPALDVVAAEPEGHLGQVVRAEAEEVRALREVGGDERGARRLDHRADRHLQSSARRDGDGLDERELDPRPGEGQLGARDRERDHDLDDRSATLLEALDGGLQERAHLHLVEAGAHHAEADAARAEHRVHLAPRRAAAYRARSSALSPSVASFTLELLGRREELVQRGVEQPHRDRQAVHRLEDLEEVGALGDAELLERVVPPRRSDARIMRRTIGRRSSARNMCSVRHSPIPSAPSRRAVAASGPVSAFARTARCPFRIASAHARIVVELLRCLGCGDGDLRRA